MEDQKDNIFMNTQMAAIRKASDVHMECIEQMKNLMKYSLMWNKLSVTLAESNLNAMINTVARWSDAGLFYQKNFWNAFGSHEQRKIDRMVMEILKHT